MRRGFTHGKITALRHSQEMEAKKISIANKLLQDSNAKLLRRLAATQAKEQGDDKARAVASPQAGGSPSLTSA